MERISQELRQVNPVMFVQYVMSGYCRVEWVLTSRNIIQCKFETQIKYQIKPILTLADIYIYFLQNVHLCSLFLPHRHISISHSQLVFMFSSSHKTCTLSLHTLDPLMHLMGAASGLTRFGSFFISFFFSLCLSFCSAQTTQLCDELWSRCKE